MKKQGLVILLLLVCLAPSIFSLFNQGFFLSDDGEWMVIRFSAFYQSLVDGQFPVRFLGRLNYGYGYPVANFLYPGFMYLAVPLQILGFGFVNSIKIIMIAGMLGGGLFAFAWLSRIFNRSSALVGALFYTYSPYHLFDLYKRGSVGEILSLMFVPFTLWAIEIKNKFLIAIGIFFLAISHNSLFLFFAPLLFVYVIVRKKLSFWDSIISFGLGILMSSFFIIPAVVELKYTNFSKIQISNINDYFANLDLIGVSSLIILFISVMIVYLKKIKTKEVYLFIVLSIISVFLSLSISSSVWNFLPGSLIQFPFRVLSYLVLSIAFLSAFVLSIFEDKKKIITLLLIFTLFFSSLNFLIPEEKFDKGDDYYSTNEATTTVKDEYMPVWVKEKPNTHFGKKVELVGGEVSNLIYNSKRIYFETNGYEGIARINTIYYPGWHAEINGTTLDISFDNALGVMEVNLPKRENKIEFKFTETPLRLFSDLISIVAFGVLVIWNRKMLINILLRKIK